MSKTEKQMSRSAGDLSDLVESNTHAPDAAREGRGGGANVYIYIYLQPPPPPQGPCFYCLLGMANLEFQNLYSPVVGPRSVVIWSPESSTMPQYDTLSK